MDYEALGKNIKKYRSLKGLTQAQLAEICNCSNSHIGQIENARVTPSLEMTVLIANALAVTVDQLLCDSYATPETVYLKEIAEHIDKYSVKQRILACESLLGYLVSLERFSQ